MGGHQLASRDQRHQTNRLNDELSEVSDSLRFNVSQLLREPFGTKLLYQLQVPPGRLTEELETSEPLRGDVRMTRTNRGLFVEVDVETALRFECSRCLEEASGPIRLTFAEEFHPVIDVVTGLPIRGEHEPDDFQIEENQELDLSEAIRQYALVNVPMQLLCRPDCAGLCPHCGQDLNTGACGCAPVEPEKPIQTGGLDALRVWLERNGEAGVSGDVAGDKASTRRRRNR
jgi:uncharacterized protein